MQYQHVLMASVASSGLVAFFFSRGFTPAVGYHALTYMFTCIQTSSVVGAHNRNPEPLAVKLMPLAIQTIHMLTRSLVLKMPGCDLDESNPGVQRRSGS